MTLHALLGLAGLNALFLVCGSALLWALGTWKTWTGIGKLLGLAYLVGVVVTGGTWTLLLIAGVPFSGWIVVGLPLVLAGACLIAGARLGRARPALGSVPARKSIIVAAVGIAACGILLEALFRSARLSGLYAWDAWSFWVPKAKAIYFSGGLDETVLAELPGPSYPPLLPVLDAAAFHAMGSVDVTTLHLQFWLFAVGFVWALAGLLSPRVPAWILWPFLVLVLVAPRLGPRFTIPEADLLLDSLFVLAALLTAFWLVDGKRAGLVLATVFLCGMVLTKREGVLLAALLIVTALLVSARHWRDAWPPLAVTAAAVAAVGVPWRVWYALQGIEGEAAGGSVDPLEDTERLGASLRLAFDVLFSSGYWSLIVPVAIGALALAALARAFTLALFFGLLVLLVTVGGGWIVWAIPDLEITQELGANPIVRYMGAAALLCAAASPLLLAAAWNASGARRGTRAG